MAKSWLNVVEVMTMNDKVDIAALRVLLAAAAIKKVKLTPDDTDYRGNPQSGVHLKGTEYSAIYYGNITEENIAYKQGRLIAAAINALPALLDELAVLRAFEATSSILSFNRDFGIQSLPTADQDSGDSIDFSHVPKGEAD